MCVATGVSFTHYVRVKLTQRLVLSATVGLAVAILVVGTVTQRSVSIRLRAAGVEDARVSAIESEVQRNLWLTGLAALALGMAGSVFVARSIARPVEDLRSVARALADGDMTRRPSLRGSGEVGELAEALRRLAEQSTSRMGALRAEEALLVALTESLNEGVIAVDARQRVVRINETARQILRLREPVPFPADYLPRDRTMRDALADVLRGEVATPSEVRVDDRTLSLTARPLPDGGAILALYDLTPFRKLEAVRRDFVANVSHELRTPLTVITGFVETLADEELPPDLRRQFVGMTASNVRRMQRIVDDLLDLSRIESGGWLPKPGDLELRAVTNEILAPLQDQAASKGVCIEAQLAEQAGRVYADPTAVRQVLSNLTQNALRHTAQGRVTIFSERSEEGVWLGVRDTGSGIAEAHLPRIFERFYRADPGRARDAGGTGLGLAIVRHLVEAHGGRVRAESVLGAGTTIAALFPNAPPESDIA